MELIFSGPRCEAVILHRILKAHGIDAVCMTGTNHPSGAVFVRAEDAENRTAISRAIERMQRERRAEGEDTCRPPAGELRWRAPKLPGARGNLRSLPAGRKHASAEATSVGQVLPRLSRTLQRAPAARGAIAVALADRKGRPTREGTNTSHASTKSVGAPRARCFGSPFVRRFSPENEGESL